jgi:hypothetical protein
LIAYNGNKFESEEDLRIYLKKFSLFYSSGKIGLINEIRSVQGPVDLEVIKEELIDSIVKKACNHRFYLNHFVFEGTKGEIKSAVFGRLDQSPVLIMDRKAYLFGCLLIWDGDLIKNRELLRQHIGYQIDKL